MNRNLTVNEVQAEEDRYVADTEKALGRKLTSNEIQHDVWELRDAKLTPQDAADRLRAWN